MNRNEIFKKASMLVGSEYSSLFSIRNNNNGYYISMKNGPYQVEGTTFFTEWSEAKTYLRENWQKLYDEIFEREILIGSEEHRADNSSEDSSAT